ncbi:hypothetical protein BTA51_14220 [Hahella sp. CCB-MM4]|uniref:hypothetical protein n=1 Tax=Hahella sp. (strain CCB-MM4) TaxID=1926491 RepID=UPI000B9B07FF|nr:hypothetical protein [Hahella sp. CCB-MM4]OZG72681.1 hypothetical protein BTA51_14220 [Hahella sp. CCB-MM4]
MDIVLDLPWPLYPDIENEFLMRCRELVAQKEECVLIRCRKTPHPSTRVLTLLLSIARLAPDGQPEWRVIEAQDNLVEALRLTGLDLWFKTDSNRVTSE